MGPKFRAAVEGFLAIEFKWDCIQLLHPKLKLPVHLGHITSRDGDTLCDLSLAAPVRPTSTLALRSTTLRSVATPGPKRSTRKLWRKLKLRRLAHESESWHSGLSCEFTPKNQRSTAASASSQNAPSRPTHASDQRPEALL